MLKVYYGLTSYSQVKRVQREVPIMVSGRWLIQLPPRSTAFQYISEYACVFLDSGAFGSAKYDGGYNYSTDDYLELVERVKPEFWASMDYPCEPTVRNGLTVEQRLQMTVENAKILSHSNTPGFMPVIQGWATDDYLDCADMFEAVGLIQPIMGIGSLCRRGTQGPIVDVVRHLHARLPNTRFHAFGVKVTTLRYNRGELFNYLDSIDTAAWQFNEKDECGGWRPRTWPELERRLNGYKGKLDHIITSPYQLSIG